MQTAFSGDLTCCCSCTNYKQGSLHMIFSTSATPTQLCTHTSIHSSTSASTRA